MGKGKYGHDNDHQSCCSKVCSCIICMILIPLILIIVGLALISSENTRVERIVEYVPIVFPHS